MRKILAAAILSAALLGPMTRANFAAEPANPPAAKAADAQANIPVKQVVLYSSGVGYFEHYGTVKDNGTTELRFKTQQINDILKSLVLQDLDKGRVGVITYPSQDPISKTLRSFQVDITNHPTFASLLGQLRGAKVTVSSGAEKITGTILGVEQKPRPVGGDKDGKGTQVVQVWFVNLITDAGIRAVNLDQVNAVVLEDKRLQDELNRALAALAGARDQDKKPVNISLQGQGERRIRIGYVVETPVWKTSYRLIVSDKAGGGEKPAAPNLGGDKPAKPTAGGGAAAKNENGSLQGWAIVENQTDNDWNDVQLSLVSGRPISFIQDLYQPLYVPRPVVQAELYASLRPQTYDDGIAKTKELRDFAGEARAEGLEKAQKSLSRRMPASPPMEQAAAKKPADGNYALGLAAGDMDRANQPMDPSASVSSIASAAKVGELFQYTVGSVSLPRQTSAMIPVVTDPVEVEKLSIYNMSVLPKNPLLGARLKNTTGKHLLQGPITVLDGGAYAGDARIDDLPPGQERLISYGVDQQILVQAQNNQQHSTLTAGKIVRGTLHLVYKDVVTQDYVAENKGDKDKTLIIEHQRLGGDWKLVEPAKADETTDTLYRFKGAVGAGKGTKLTVKTELVRNEEIAILSWQSPNIIAFCNTGNLAQPIKDALLKVASLQQEQYETQRQIQERQNKINLISQEQTRLRENMKTVSQNTEYYTRLLKKLDEQESSIETLQKEIGALQKTLEKQQKDFVDHVNALNVG
jgi:hypothetical protein